MLVIKTSVLTTERHARKTGLAAQSDTDNAKLVFGHATLVACTLQRLPGGATGCGEIQELRCWKEYALREVGRSRNRNKTIASA
jgi:hypothetical protein